MNSLISGSKKNIENRLVNLVTYVYMNYAVCTHTLVDGAALFSLFFLKKTEFKNSSNSGISFQRNQEWSVLNYYEIYSERSI